MRSIASFAGHCFAALAAIFALAATQCAWMCAHRSPGAAMEGWFNRQTGLPCTLSTLILLLTLTFASLALAVTCRMLVDRPMPEPGSQP